ncbi:hypothetical protein ACJMK2_017818 [Sinanodonta woodiana]|uniref:Uncharacterized protein n=1 Tax=Sinanodonta woodiana TaxID=1069815 RepID=A0ABD3UBH4_SINWO
MSRLFRSFDIDASPFADTGIYQRNLRMERRYSREAALKHLNNMGIAGEGGDSPWINVLHTKEQAASINVDGIKYLAKLIVDPLIHWLPLHISDYFKLIPCPFQQSNRSYKRPDHSR